MPLLLEQAYQQRHVHDGQHHTQIKQDDGSLKSSGKQRICQCPCGAVSDRECL